MILLKVGRSDACNIKLNSPNVSSLHAEILVLDDGTVIVEDKNSTNGTYVGNERLEPGRERQVRRGDLVRFADVDLNWAQVPHPPRYTNMKQVVNIGSNYRNNLVVDDPFVSRFHAVLKIDKKNRAYITDIGSRNGTIVNGMKIPVRKDHLLKKGDNVTLGNKDVSEEINALIPKKSSILKWVAIGGGVAAFLAAAIIGIFFLLGGKNVMTGCNHPWPPQEARSAVVYVNASYQLVARLEDSPISAEIWDAVISDVFPNAIAKPGELPYEQVSYYATAFFIDREGRLATNRHVAKPWDLKYLEPGKEEEVRTTVDRYVQDQQLPPYVSSLGEINAYNELAEMSPRFALWRMVYAQAVKEYQSGRERNPVAYINSLIRQLRHSKVTVDGHMVKITIGYPGRNYTNMSEFNEDICTVIAVYPDDKVDLAIIQHNKKVTPATITRVFEPSSYFTGDLVPLKDKLVWIGYPRGATWNLDEDTKSLEPQIRETMAAKMPSKYNFEFQGESVGGASGSPIFNPKTGELVGVLWGGWAGASTYGQAVQAKYLKKLYEDEVGPVE